MKPRISLLSVALAVCSTAPLAAQTLTTWSDPVKVTASNGALTKSSGCDGCADSGAHSATQLTGDGYSEFVAPALTRLFAGLGADLTASTSSSGIDYAFSLWPSGVWEVRELGVYRKDGTYAAGDRFRVAVESGVVVYRRNGAIVYTSKTLPVSPLGLDVTLYALGASVSQATVAAATTPPPPPPPPDPTGTVTSIGPYQAITDRNIYPKPPLPTLGPAGTAFTDPVFTTSIRRVTDNFTRPGTVDRSYRTPSSPHQNAWSVNATYFYIMGSGGIGPIPYAFNAATGTAQRLQPTTTGDGGMVLKFYIEPQFSYVSDSIIYGSYNGAGSTLHTIDQYDFSSGLYTRLMDLDALVPGLSGTYIGGIASSGGSTERVEAFFGGTSQDRHHYAIVFDRANPQNRQIIDTLASTINGSPAPITLNFSLHHAMIDRSGRYVMLYTTSVDQGSPRYAAQEYLWDLQTGNVTELGAAAHPYGHDAFGYGVLVNKDCCTTTAWDAGQWQFRTLSSPLVTRDLIKTLLSPKETYLSDHTTWNNARADRLTPVVSGLYRYGTNTVSWRPWDDEIVAIQTDAASGTDATVWRFAHHRTDVSYDGDATRVAFWYQPHPNVSQDGRWILYTSNWEKTLGTDSAGEAGTGARQDVFLLALKPATVAVAIATTALPSGRVATPYSAALSATGGSGVYVWSTPDPLPAGLSLNAGSGAIAGTPSVYGTSTVRITAADAANGANSATASFAITIAPSAVTIVANPLPGGQVTQAYSTTVQASGGTGSYVWSIASGTLPSGLTLDAGTGTLSGTPSSAGTWSFVLHAADATDASNAADAQSTIAITPAPVQIAPTILPSGRALQPYSATLAASGGSGTYAWSVVSGTLPAGISLGAATGTLTGIPTAAGAVTFTIRASDCGDATNAFDRTFSISIAPAPVLVVTATLAGGRVSLPYSSALVASGGSGAYRWSIVAGSLPAGVLLDPVTGSLSGIPSAAGVFGFTAAVADAGDASNSATAALSIVVGNAPVRITTTALPGGRERVSYGATLQASGGGGAIVWSAALPAGLSLTGSGTISGTPTTAGTYSVTLHAVDSTDATNAASATLTMVIAAAIKITSPRTLPDAFAGVTYSYTIPVANVVGTPKWNIQGGSLPQGMSLNSVTGTISGVSTKKGSYSFNARVRDANTADTLTLTISVK